MTATCPWCSAPRETGPTCPRCGAIYAKAEAIRTHGRAAAASAAPIAMDEPPDEPMLETPAEKDWPEVDDAGLEHKLCIGAIPVALLLALAFHASGISGALQRIFLTMPVHEFGHAVSAWLCGYTAIPTLWKTIVPDTRGFIAPLALGGGLGYLMYRAHLAQNRPLLYAAAALLALQAIGTLLLSERTANMLIIFGGDGMGMILAIVLMGTFYFGKGTQLYKGWLRWGFLCIGAAAFVDMYATWWSARSNVDAVPFGTLDGNATDASKLVEEFGWSIAALIDRFFALGLVCLAALSLVYAWGLRRAAQVMQTRADAARLADHAKRIAQRS